MPEDSPYPGESRIDFIRRNNRQQIAKTYGPQNYMSNFKGGLQEIKDALSVSPVVEAGRGAVEAGRGAAQSHIRQVQDGVQEIREGLPNVRQKGGGENLLEAMTGGMLSRKPSPKKKKRK